MVGGMEGGMTCVMKCISTCKQFSKWDIQACEEELLKDKSISSEKSEILGDEYSRLRGGSSKKGYDIYDYDISENKYISETWEKDRTMALKA